MTITSFPIQTRRVNLQKILDAETYAGDAEAARDQAQTARDTASDHKLAAEAAATSATNTAASLTGFDLDAIAESKAETAVDVFVYDTSKDSDGGAWRKRTQHTSWYNETLNTATRGSRREFPAVAVIVAEAAKVTIYDGDDPALPMWMVFNGGGFDDVVNFSITSITMTNGKLCRGADGYDIVCVDFLGDRAARAGAGTTYGPYKGNIEQRNDSLGWLNSTTSFLSSEGTVSRAVNDVAMTVLPDAPIDPATGLPVPTIAVATDGGVSVIKDDGTVVDSGATAGFANVAFTPENYLWASRDAYNLIFIYTDQYFSNGFGSIFGSVWRQPAAGVPSNITPLSNLVTAQGGSTFDGLREDGFSLSRTELGSPETADHCFFTSTYNTGWMNGDIKGAFLSDTDDTDLVGSELITNGTFDTDSDWTKGTGWTISGGVASADGSATSSTELAQAITTVSGQKYVTSFEISNRTAGGVRLRIAGQEVGLIKSDDGTYVYTWVANSTSETLSVQDTTGDFVGDIDNFSTKLADEDRSVNNNGLIVNGTVTRSPVATGADLVAYSGFSASNYLEQPYNSDLDFGTGDFCIMGWCENVGGSTERFVYRFDGSDTSDSSGWDFRTRSFDDLSLSVGGANIIASGSVPASGWSLYAAVRKSGVIRLFVNGEEVGSTSFTVDVSYPNSVIRIGSGFGGVGGNAPLALWRISATAPTAEQIAKIYEDEKVLFQENAQATLYGTSDAVTALAHDPVTDLLHVGTSAGRSVFQGLRRVSNTTDAVTTAISASNDLIVEQ